MDNKIEFLYQSISDIQATIRAIDVKIGFLFLVAFMPIAVLKDVVIVSVELWRLSAFYLILEIPIALSWFISIIYLFLALTSISNPSARIIGNKPLGFFYGEFLFNIKCMSINAVSQSKSTLTVSEVCDLLPDGQVLIEELVYEKMKITYIREIKLRRYVVCTRLIYCWFFSGVVTCLFFFFSKALEC